MVYIWLELQAFRKMQFSNRVGCLKKSVEFTRHALRVLQIDSKTSVVTQDLFDADHLENVFDSIVFSEVVEHLDDPVGRYKY